MHIAIDHEEDQAQDDEELDERHEKEEITQVVPAAALPASGAGVWAAVHGEPHLRSVRRAHCQALSAWPDLGRARQGGVFILLLLMLPLPGSFLARRKWGLWVITTLPPGLLRN